MFISDTMIQNLIVWHTFLMFYVNGRYLSAHKDYCCFRDGKKHVLCRNPNALPPPECLDYKEILSVDESEILVVLEFLNELRDDVARGNISNWPQASSMNKLKESKELTMIAKSMGAMCTEDFSDQEIGSIHYQSTFIVITRTNYTIHQTLPRPIEVIMEEIDKFKQGSSTPSILEKFDQKSDYPIAGLLYDFLRWVGCTSNTRAFNETEEERKTREKDGKDPKVVFQIICIAGPVEGIKKTEGKSYKQGKPRSACYWEYSGKDSQFPHLCASAVSLPISIFTVILTFLIKNNI